MTAIISPLGSLLGLNGNAPKPVNHVSALTPPALTDQSAQSAALLAQQAAARTAGRASTIATSGQGDTSSALVSKKTLLGV